MNQFLYATKRAWIGKPFIDTVFILLPPFLSLLIIVLFPRLFQNNNHVPDSLWVILILLIDVAHVYSTLYRTYFDKHMVVRQRNLLILIPVLSFVASVLVYSSSAFLFWRLLAYLAVFHFVRQQYGFMRLYSRKEQAPRWMVMTDKVVIYYATIYPLIYWHLSGPRNFNWFISGDFMYISSALLLKCATAFYYAVVACYLIKEIIFVYLYREVNIPKIAVISGTIISWYFGIVYFNGDLAFTLLNVVSHGIPYMALVWIYSRKEVAAKGSPFGRSFSLLFSLMGFLAVIFLLAYLEEALWDIFLWKEHQHIFGTYQPEVNEMLLCFIIALLAVPQITHYIIDGYIWKLKRQQK
ncbi:MAG: hypothetical protein JNL13_06410 [Chitinophagaceae bacterium]|nr:hypothetical protein [Chitinophagaceae bacterium]